MSTHPDDPLQFLKDLTGDSTLAMAVLGAVVTVFGSFVPFSPVIGGGLAGYLARGSRSEGARVGAISGAVAFLPGLLAAGLLSLIGFFGLFLDPAGFVAGMFFVAFALFVGGATLVYFVGFSTLGGWLGAYFFDEYVRDRDVARSRSRGSQPSREGGRATPPEGPDEPTGGRDRRDDRSHGDGGSDGERAGPRDTDRDRRDGDRDTHESDDDRDRGPDRN